MKRSPPAARPSAFGRIQKGDLETFGDSFRHVLGARSGEPPAMTDLGKVLMVLPRQLRTCPLFPPPQRFPEEPKHLQDKDLCVHYFAKKSLSWYAPNIRP